MAGLCFLFANICTVFFLVKRFPKEPSPSTLDVKLLSEISSQLCRVEERDLESAAALSSMPSRILRTLQGSVNTTTGKLGELVKFIELQRVYDRLIPVGNIVDFIGVSFPSDESSGRVDFIDVKTGKRAVLSKEQKILKKLIEEGLISFNVVKVEIE